MGYQALLFCPDEKTARTVTQVLSELEFTVEACLEPFAAVKKLMGQHFDAVVVDCDNEQNATLLFKSARNSTSNQASLAVAVVEGQAGVAKAFRIGANLVLTKPINIEQAKGTLRVARGLLRKGEPAKPPATSAAHAGQTPKPVAAKPAPPVKAAAPVTSAAIAPRTVAIPESKPAPAAAWPSASASSVPVASDDDLLEISDDSVAAPVKVATPDLPPVQLPAAASSIAEGKLPSVATHGSGAASAPAPAREIPASQVTETSPVIPEAQPLSDKPAEAASIDSSSYAGPEPSFTFGGANVSTPSNGGSKKILIGVAAAAIVAVGLYVGYTTYQGRSAAAENTQTQVAPVSVAVPQAAKPSLSKPAPATSATSQPLFNAPHDTSPAKNHVADDDDFTSEDSSLSNSTKPSSSASPSTGKTPADAKTAAQPLVVKGGRTPSIHPKAGAADAPAPSIIGIATAGAGAPPDLVGAQPNAPKPVLQTLSVSQGVSQGLLLKKVQPSYPKNALVLRIEGAVQLLATVSKSGDITRVKILSGDSQLTRAASDAVKQWKYKPYLLNGEPVEIQTEISINFKLPK